MRALFACLGVLFAASVSVVAENLDSTVYPWSDPVSVDGSAFSSKLLLKGETTHLQELAVEACVIGAGSELTATVPADRERLILVKSGILRVRIGESDHAVERGSVAMLLPGQKYRLASEAGSEFHLMTHRSKLPVDLQRGLDAGGSFVVDWKDLRFRAHAQGGRRDFFDHPTAMCEDFEMHATSLRGLIQSHPPHTHIVEEIILLIEGRTEMEVGGKTVRMSPGDLVFIDSTVRHGIRNLNETPSTYFAFQWK